MTIFDILAPAYNHLHFGAKKTFKRISSLAEFNPQDKVLDLGGGSGRIARFFGGLVSEIIVIDASAAMVKQCLKQNKIKCETGYAEKISYPDDYFDKIIIVDAFHHFDDQSKAVQELKRVLKPGGKVLIEEINSSTKTFFGRLAVKIERMFFDECRHLSPFSLAGLFSQNGFRTKTKNENNFIYHLIAEK